MHNYLPYSTPTVRSFADSRRLPDRPGVYIVTSGKRILYVGRATVSIRRRCLQKHYDSASDSDQRLVSRVERVGGAKLIALPIPFGKHWIASTEGRLIRKLKPEFNTQRDVWVSPLVSGCEGVLTLVFVLVHLLKVAAGAAALGYLGWRLFQVLVL